MDESIRNDIMGYLRLCHVIQLNGLKKTTYFRIIVSNLDLSPVHSAYKPVSLILMCSSVFVFPE